jgi:hypothetical protein
MTPEQIREEAIEAAEAALRRAMNSGLSIEFAFPAAIDAYEKALWQDACYLQPHHGHAVMVQCTSGRTDVAICVWERSADVPQWHWADVGRNEPNFTNRVVPARFRPLPQPPEVK